MGGRTSPGTAQATVARGRTGARPDPGPVTDLSQRPDERARLAAVHRYDILDSPPEEAFDRIAAMAARLLKTPMATVAFVDADRVWFKAVHGLEGVRQVGCEPGLCTSVIECGKPMAVRDARADAVARSHPLVAGKPGVEFYAAAPIITSQGHRIGTVSVMDTRPRRFGPQSAAALADLAALVMDRLELRLSALQMLQEERRLREEAERQQAEVERFATTLQRTLVPPALPRISGMELASHYQTASSRHVGGDFYDVFALDHRRWAFFVGDVCGKGAVAASVTSLIRYTLRAAALHQDDPEKVLEELNTALNLDPHHGGRFCTAVFGILEPAADGGFTVKVATGGHPPMMLLRAPRPGEPARVESVEVYGMLIGALPEAVFSSTTLHLAPGDGLLAYTDGLIEARPDGGGILGHEGLQQRLAAHVNRVSRETRLSAPSIVADTIAMLDTFVQGSGDDIAVLALHALTHPSEAAEEGPVEAELAVDMAVGAAPPSDL